MGVSPSNYPMHGTESSPPPPPPTLFLLACLGAVYICTEDAFPSKRWHQLAISFASKYNRLHLTANKLSDNLYIEHAATVVSMDKDIFYLMGSEGLSNRVWSPYIICARKIQTDKFMPACLPIFNYLRVFVAFTQIIQL